MPDISLKLSLLEGRLAVCRLDPGAEIPEWAIRDPFFSITRTVDELSVICPEQHVPPGVAREQGWRALKLEGPFDLESIGILSAVAEPLADAEVSILAIATYDTDYVLIKESELERALVALSKRGHRIPR